jgi:DNA polymerase III alpha subunit
VRTFGKKNDKGEGKVANCLFLDNSSRIQIVFWDKEVEKHFSKLEEGKAYIISGGEVRKSSKYNNSGNPLEIVCNKETLILTADENSSNDIKKFDINVDTIRSVQHLPINSKITVLAFALSDPVKEIIKKKDGTSLNKIVLKVADQSQNSIDVVAWGDSGEPLMKVKEKQIILLTNLTLREFNNVKNLSYYTESRVVISPKVDSKQITDLEKFKNQLTDDQEINDISKNVANATKQGTTVLHTLAIAKDAERRILYGNEEKVFYNTYAYLDVLSVTKNITWQKSDLDEFIFLATAKIADSTHAMWVTMCAGGETILGVSAKEAHKLQQEDRNQAGGEGTSDLKKLVNRRKGNGFWVKLRAQKNSY